MNDDPGFDGTAALQISDALPDGWAATTLGEAFRWGSGGTPLSSVSEYYDGDIPWAIIGDLNDGVVNRTQRTITPLGLENSSAKLIEPGHVLVAMYGSIGKLGIAGMPMATNQAIAFTKPDPVDARYLFWHLRSIRNDLFGLGKGGTQRNISQTVLKSVPFPVAPLPEQRRIVAEIETQFTRLDAAVAALERGRENLKRYRASVIQAAATGELLGKSVGSRTTSGSPDLNEYLTSVVAQRAARWDSFSSSGGRTRRYSPPARPASIPEVALPADWTWASVEELSAGEPHSLAIGPFGSNLKVSDYKEQGVPLVFVRNIRSGRFGKPNTAYISELKAVELHAHSVSGGDLLVTKMGDPPGDARLYPLDLPDAVITADCIKVRLSPMVNSRFIEIAVNSDLVRRQVTQVTRGVAQQKMSLGRFSTIALPLPPPGAQQAIVDEVDRRLSVAEKIEDALVGSLQRTERLRETILCKAFAGQLVPQDPTDEPASVLLERIREERALATAKRPVKRSRDKKDQYALW